MTNIEKVINIEYKTVVDSFEKYNKRLKETIDNGEYEEIVKLANKLNAAKVKLELLEKLKEELEEEKIRKNIKSLILINGRWFYLGLVTEKYIFYVDEDGRTIMYKNNDNMDFLNDSYIAYAALMDELDEINKGKKAIFESESVKEHREIL